MSVLSKIFGSRKLTTALIAEQITQHEAERVHEQARGKKANDILANVALLSDDDHLHAETEAAAAARAIVRINARLVELRSAHIDAVKADDRAALRKRADAVRRRVDGTPALIDRYEALATQLAEVAAEFQSISNEVENVNNSIQLAKNQENRDDHPEFVQNITTKFLTEPDHITPERVSIEEYWEESDWSTNQYRPCLIFDGDEKPINPAARKTKKEIKIPEKVRKGRFLYPPCVDLQLPPVRIGQKPFWPIG